MPRYIDADAFRKKLQNLAHDDWNQITFTTWSEAYEDIADMIDEQPTVKAVPWKKLERYAEFFCADVPYTEFVRMAKLFYLDAERSEDE